MGACVHTETVGKEKLRAKRAGSDNVIATLVACSAVATSQNRAAYPSHLQFGDVITQNAMCAQPLDSRPSYQHANKEKSDGVGHEEKSDGI
jgi:hypothetical protein